MAADAAPAPASAPAAAGLGADGRTAKELYDVADGLRNRVDLFGKVLAAIASLGTTAVGLNRIDNVFPTAGHVWWAVAACVALGAAALAAIWVAVRLMMVAGPAFISIDPAGGDDISTDERGDQVEPIFKATAKQFGYTSLPGLLERERSMREAAAQAEDDAERARRTALADDVGAAIEQALARSQVAVVRRRAMNAVSDRLSCCLYVVVIAGLIVFALGTGRVASARTSVADAKACGDARTAGATAGELAKTKVCDGTAAAPPATAKPSAAEVRAELSTKIAAVLQACAAATSVGGLQSGRPLVDGDCAPLRHALAALNAP